MVKAYLHLPCLPMPRRTPRNQTSASPSTGPRTQPRRMTMVPRPPITPWNTQTIPRLSPPPYRDSLSPTPGPSRLSMQPQFGSEQPPLQPNLQQPFILHFSVPHATIVQPGHTSNPRSTIPMARGGASNTVRHHPQTRIRPLPHSLVEQANLLPQ